MQTTPDPVTITAWLASVAALFGIGFGIMRLRLATTDRIELAKAVGIEAKAECARLEQRILETSLDATQRYASIPHLSSVERRLSEEIKLSEARSKETMNAMEKRLIETIKQRREKHS